MKKVFPHLKPIVPSKLFFQLLFILLITTCPFDISGAQDLIQAPAAIHISSVVSDSKYSIAEIVRIAKENKIKIVIVTDRDLMRWEYGLWPLRNIIKKTVEANSIFKYGIGRYLKDIENIQKANQDILLIAGLESAPFYYWQGSAFDNSLKMYNWHKHILAIGLDAAVDYKNLPSIGNPRALRTKFQLYKLWPIIFLLAGFFCFKKRKYNYRDLQGKPLGPFDRRFRVCGLSLVVIGILFFINNWPFYGVKYDQYHGDLRIMPYQNFIDYINRHGGLTFWAHPEAEYIQNIEGIKIETREHTSDLIQTDNYTGFAIFYEGYNKVGLPSGLWDAVLKQYCAGKRKAPIWAIGGLSFESAGDLSGYMNNLRTIFLVPKLNKQEVLKALRQGRMYVVRGKDASQFALDKFIITDTVTNNGVTIGEKIFLSDKPKIEIGGHFLNGQRQAFKIKLIRNGSVIKTFEVTSPFEITYQDEYNAKDNGSYYRVEMRSEVILLITNPIFCIYKTK